MANPQVIFLIMEELPLISVLALLRAVPEMRSYVNGYAVARARISKFLPPGMMDQEDDFAITGSLLLKVLLGAGWMHSDIDICGQRMFKVPAEELSPNSLYHPEHLMIAGWLYDNGHLAHPNPDHDNPHTTSRSVSTTEDTTYDHMPFVTQIRNYDVDRTNPKPWHFQCMTISSSHDAYVRNFDFRVCCNYMTPTKLVIMFPEVLLHNSEMTVHILSTYLGYVGGLRDTHAYAQCVIKRIRRYRQRGFHIKLDLDELENDGMSPFQRNTFEAI